MLGPEIPDVLGTVQYSTVQYNRVVLHIHVEKKKERQKSAWSASQYYTQTLNDEKMMKTLRRKRNLKEKEKTNAAGDKDLDLFIVDQWSMISGQRSTVNDQRLIGYPLFIV